MAPGRIDDGVYCVEHAQPTGFTWRLQDAFESSVLTLSSDLSVRVGSEAQVREVILMQRSRAHCLPVASVESKTALRGMLYGAGHTQQALHRPIRWKNRAAIAHASC
jgi:hypothetical protein